MYSLSRQAQLDRLKILENLAETERFGGVIAARRVDAILEDCLERIADGRILGHRRHDLKTRRPLLFTVATPTKYVVAFDPETRLIVRILHGARHLKRLF